MKRRKFIASSALTATAGVVSANSLRSTTQNPTNEIYELKTYELAFRGDQKSLLTYFNEVLKPALFGVGAKNSMIFSEVGNPEPKKLWVLNAYPNFDVYQKSIALATQKDFIEKSAAYANAGKIYNRISSSLLYAFDGLKQMLDPIKDTGLFELRIYEGSNEDAVRRKIKMFNNEEIDLFYRTDLNPVFFGKMLTGPYEPCLVYMLSFRNMEHRDEAWKSFGGHPDWNKMRVKEEYKDTVSNIRKIFLNLI